MTTATMEQEQVSESLVELGVDVRRQAIEGRVLLLSPTVGRWEGRYKIPSEMVEMTIDGANVDKDQQGITTPHTVMMTDLFPLDRNGVAWKKRFNQVLKIKDRVIARYSVPFQMAGARIVPKHRGSDFFGEMIGLTLGKLRRDLQRADDAHDTATCNRLHAQIAAALRANPHAVDSTPVHNPTKNAEEQSFAYQWALTADEFCDNLDNVLEQIKANLKPASVWNVVQSRLPLTRELMRAKFYTAVYPVELATGGSFTGVTADLLNDYRDVVDQAMAAAVNGCIEQVIEAPRDELYQALASLRDLVARDGHVTTKSFRPVHAAIEKLRNFSFACTPEMMAEIDRLERRLTNTTPTTLTRATAANNGFTAALESVMSEVHDATKAEKDYAEFGRDLRGFSL